MKLRLDAFGSALGYAYVLRMPLVIWLALLALPLVAVPKGAALGPLLRGLFDLTDPLERGVSIGAFEHTSPPVSLLSHGVEAWSFALVTLASLMAVSSIGIIARLILRDGAERFKMPPVPASPGVEVALRLLLGLPPLLIVGAALKQSADTFSSLAFMVAGIVVGVAAFARGLVPMQRAVWTHVFNVDGSKRPPTLLTRPIHASLRLFESLIAHTPSGFVAADGRLRSRHVFAWFQMLASLLLYLTVFLLKWQWLPVYNVVRIPTLCLLLMLAMIAGWTLGAMSFLLDRFRIPVITLLVAYGTLMSVFPQGDHFFFTVTVKPPAHAPRADTPSQVLGWRDKQPAIAVAAMGGGIHAGAWVARVLAGLQIDSMRCGTDFDRALSVISSVSGGSMGAMYIVDAYKDGRLTDEKALSGAVKASEGSSLDDVAWALTYPDLAWTLFPFAKGIWLWPPALFTGPNLVLDRGTALEDSWKRTTPLETSKLDDWRKDVSAHQRPAVIFNSTVVETGERMLLGTTTIDGQNATGRVDFGVKYPGSDVLVVTAARLSSTFPYVSPPARIRPDGRFENDFHMVDGGYYDNYGTQTLVEWLAQSLDDPTRWPSRLLLLEIRTFPPASERKPDARRGWIFEATHPLVTLGAVRTSAQLSTAKVMADLLRRTGDGYVRSLSFGFPSHVAQDVDDVSPALSWHLTPRDRGRLREAWDDPETKRARALVQLFLANDSFTEDAISHCIR
jgi:hypothetical protein